ncbi:MAG: Uma2 family endonuclease, partial [Leptolyngbya sp. SIO4C1]|nr:Uma2 family endonuclease [Leptolyngbya sp. SIO4C1]
AVGVNRCVDNLQLPTVSIYQLVDGAYQLKQFRGEQMVESPTFPHLRLSAQAVFQTAVWD